MPSAYRGREKPGPFVAGAFTLGALASCDAGGSGEDGEGAGRDSPPAETPAEDTAGTNDAGATTIGRPTTESVQTRDGGGVVVMRDGVWEVGDAGEVEFRFENGSLALDSVRPNPGRNVEVAEEAPDEIEVGFARDNAEWKFEVEAEGNVLRVERQQDLDPAEAENYAVGDAGEVEVGLEDGGLVLRDARANQGWNVRVEEQTSDEIEVDFVRGNVERQFEAEIDDGEVDVRVDERISGPIAN